MKRPPKARQAWTEDQPKRAADIGQRNSPYFHSKRWAGWTSSTLVSETWTDFYSIQSFDYERATFLGDNSRHFWRLALTILSQIPGSKVVLVYTVPSSNAMTNWSRSTPRPWSLQRIASKLMSSPVVSRLFWGRCHGRHKALWRDFEALYLGRVCPLPKLSLVSCSRCRALHRGAWRSVAPPSAVDYCRTCCASLNETTYINESINRSPIFLS